MDIKTQEQTLLTHLVPVCYNSIFEAKDGLVYWWDEILAAMTEWERQQNHVLREENERLREGLKEVISECESAILLFWKSCGMGEQKRKEEIEKLPVLVKAKHLLTPTPGDKK